MTEHRWKFSQIVSLSFVAMILVAAIAGAVGKQGDLLSDIVVRLPVVAQEAP